MNNIVLTKKIGDEVSIGYFSILYETVEIGDDVTIGEGCVIGRKLKPTDAMVRKVKSNDEIIKIGDRTSICSNVTIYNNVVLGEDVLIGDNTSILDAVIIGDKTLISRNVTINSSVNIGSNTRIMDNTHITGRVKIGSNVFISVGVSMANDNSFGINGYDKNVQGPIIEDYVSIGVGAVLLPGVRVGKGSIVAAGSVVKDDVEANVIVAGNPAKKITRVPKRLRRL